jgi:hypothetical protein
MEMHLTFSQLSISGAKRLTEYLAYQFLIDSSNQGKKVEDSELDKFRNFKRGVRSLLVL